MILKRNRLGIAVALAAVLALASCSQDELADGGNMLPDGQYPLEIASATLAVEGSEQPWTKVGENVDGTGSEFREGDAIRVSLNDKTATYTYDGSAWTSDTPLYWQSTQQATVNAWYPANGSVSLANQSSSLAYVLKGSGDGSYQSGVNLTFTHQLAKVRVVLTGDKASDVTQVEIYSYTTCTHSQGTISTDGASQDWITMHQADYNGTKYWEANVVPGTITPDKFIRLNGSSVATVSGITDLAAGSMYTVNLNVEAADPGYTIDADGTYQVYTAEGLQAWAAAMQGSEDPNLNCTLTADITLTGTNNWTPVGNYNYPYSGTFDGAGHTISGMNISSSSAQGFIARLSGTVKNLTITNALVSGANNIGGIVGQAAQGSKIIGCAFSGTVKGTTGVGGIVGDANGCNVTACWSTAEATASMPMLGCIAGSSMQSTYTACYWENTTTTAGIGEDTDAGVIHVGDNNVTWITAMNAMNNALESVNKDYRWTVNDNSDKDEVPLVLVPVDEN